MDFAVPKQRGQLRQQPKPTFDRCRQCLNIQRPINPQYLEAPILGVTLHRVGEPDVAPHPVLECLRGIVALPQDVVDPGAPRVVCADLAYMLV